MGRVRFPATRNLPAAIRRSGFAALSLFVLASPSFAQIPPPRGATQPAPQTFMIRGSLRLASTNQAVEMMKVELKKVTGEIVSVTFTSSAGQFEFGGLTSGDYLLVVEEKGFDPIRETVEVRHTGRTGIYLLLREPLKLGAKPGGPTVPARELALSSNAAETLRKGRQELFDKENAAGSLKHFQKLASQAPDFYEAHYYAGIAFSELDRGGEAEASFRKAIVGSGETHAPSYVALAAMLTKREQFLEAEAMARRGSELDPDSWLGHFELARALLALGRANEALPSAQAARERRPDHPDICLLMANIHLKRRDPQGLLTAMDDYLKLRPEGPMSDNVREARKNLMEEMAQSEASRRSRNPNPPH